MDISGRQWLLAILLAISVHLLLLACSWLAHAPAHRETPASRGIMVSLDNFDTGPPPAPTRIEDMPIENLQQNNTIASAPPAAAAAPVPDAAQAPAPAAPAEAPTIGPEPGGEAPAVPSSAPGEASTPTFLKTGGSANTPAIASAVTIRPSDELSDIRPQNQVTARDAAPIPGANNTEQNPARHNGAYGSSEEATDDYIVRLRAWLSRHKQYPQAARQQGVEGTVKLYIAVGRDGHVLSQRIMKSSGSKMLDQAAEQMLAHAEPLPAMPTAMQHNRLELIVPIVFTLH